MNDELRRRFEMLSRVDAFGRSFASSFPTDSRGGQLFAAVRASIGEIESGAASQTSHSRAVQQGTASKTVARAELLEDMQFISMTAKAIALSMPGLDDKFRLPRNASDQSLLAAARAFARDAASLSEEFVKREMAATFLDDLNSAINEMALAIDGRIQTTAARVSATASLDDALERGLTAAQELNAVVKNKLRDDRAALAEWTSARHVERRARKSKPAPRPSSQQPAAS